VIFLERDCLAMRETTLLAACRNTASVWKMTTIKICEIDAPIIMLIMEHYEDLFIKNTLPKGEMLEIYRSKI
jgi:hypothetical protein